MYDVSIKLFPKSFSLIILFFISDGPILNIPLIYDPHENTEMFLLYGEKNKFYSRNYEE